MPGAFSGPLRQKDDSAGGPSGGSCPPPAADKNGSFVAGRRSAARLKFAVAAVAVAALFASVAVPAASDAVHQGDDADPADYPWTAALFELRGSNWVYICGAVFITELWLKTAGHCVDNHNSKEVRVALGKDVNSGNQVNSSDLRSLTKVVIYSPREYPVEPERLNWRDLDGTDVALIRLDKPVPGSQPIALALGGLLSRSDTYDGDTVTILGWGSTKDSVHEDKSPDQLQIAELVVRNDRECFDLVTESETADFQYCAKADRRGFLNRLRAGARPGDSGSPAVARSGGQWVLHGIVIGGPKACEKDQTGPGCGSFWDRHGDGDPDYVALLTVSLFANWANRVIEAHGDPPPRIGTAKSDPRPGFFDRALDAITGWFR